MSQRGINIKYYLPAELREIILTKQPDNFSLTVSKLIPFFSERGLDKPKLKDYVEKILGFRNLKIKIPINEYKVFFENVKALWISKNAEMFSLQTKYRLVIGLGDESIYETSIRLHRNYGTPYIPGSALKGVTKHWAILKLTEKLHGIDRYNNADFFDLAEDVQKWLEEPEEDKIPKDVSDVRVCVDSTEITFNEFRKIFGTQKYEGTIIFFDALPNPESLDAVLELDIMNPHYQPYYSASDNELRTNPEKAPGDWHQPNPIFFLTVPEGIKFQFAIAPRNDDGNGLIDKAKAILRSALTEFGVGAKTSLGYGRFE